MAIEQGLSAQRIYRDLVVECSFTGSYTTLNAGSLRRISMMPGVLPEPQSQPAREQQQLRTWGSSGQIQTFQNGKAFNHLDAVPAIMIDIPHTSVMRRAESEAGFRTRHIQRFCGQRLVLRPTNRPQSVDCVLINYLQDSRRSWAAAVHLKPGLVFH